MKHCSDCNYIYNYIIYIQRCRKHFESGGCISTFFLFFCQFQKVGGVTKSRPIDPLFDVIYLFLNVSFGQKVFKFTVFGRHDLCFACIIWYFLPSTQIFLLHSPKFF